MSTVRTIGRVAAANALGVFGCACVMAADKIGNGFADVPVWVWYELGALVAVWLACVVIRLRIRRRVKYSDHFFHGRRMREIRMMPED